MNPRDSAFLLFLSSGNAPEPAVAEAALAGGLDPRDLALRLRGEGLRVAAQGGAERLALAGAALDGSHANWAVVTAAQVRELPGVGVAGGVAPHAGAVSLRVHGRPAGPPPGAPLLMIFGDLGRQDAAGSSSPRPGDALTQRILRATYPVFDVVWPEARLRVPLKQMSFRGLEGAGLSVAENALLLLRRLAEQSGGAVLDLGYDGQDVGVDPLRGAQEPLEGADRDRLARFERYAAAATLAFARGLYPSAAPGELGVVGAGGDSPRATAPSAVLSPRPAREATKSPVPWIRRARPRRKLSGSLRSFLPFTPLIFFVLFHACVALSPRTEERGARVVAGVLMAAGGVGLVLFGLRALSRRERLRAVPTSKIRSLPMGTAEVAGRIVSTASFKAPYSRTPCVWYRFEVEEKGGGDEEQRHVGWHVIQRGGSGEIPFRVEDSTGSVLVQPAGARLDVEPRAVRVEPRLRVREWILTEGEFVYVSGEAHRRSAVEGISGGEDENDIFLGAGADGHLVISQRSHEEQERRFAGAALLSFAGGVVSLLLAVLLFAR